MSRRSLPSTHACRTNQPVAVGLCRGLACLLSPLFAIGVLLAASAAPAYAERVYESKIEGFGHPDGIAIDGNGNVWISDPGHEGLISEYDAYPSQTKKGEQNGAGSYGNAGELIFGIAFGAASGDLYVAENTDASIDVFENGTGLLQEQWGGLGGFPLTVAVDNSGGPSSGLVYVAGAGTIKAFETNHEEADFSAEEPYITGNSINGTPGGPFGAVENVAVDSHGNIYVVDAGYRVVDEFNSSGVFLRAFGETSTPPDFGMGNEPGGIASLTGVAVDPTNNHVLVVDSSNAVVDEFSSSGEYLGQLTGPEATDGESFHGLGGGIAVNPEGYVYVSEGWEYAQQGGNGAVDIFSPVTVRPKISYGPVTDKTQTSGRPTATVNLNAGPNVTGCAVEYGPSATYGSTVPCSPATPYTGTTEVSADLSGLTTETTYHYRVVVVTTNGTKRGTDQTFTPRAVADLTTEPATEITRAAATVYGSFTGNSEETDYYFEWGESETYGHKTVIETAGSPNEHEHLVESAALTDLSLETNYHYRFVAENSVGTTYGPDQSFETLAAVENLRTGPAKTIKGTTASLTASWTGDGTPTDCYFEWGPETSYGNLTSAPPGVNVGSGSGPQSESSDLTELTSNTVYHFRAVCTNSTGTTYGNDESFQTLTIPAASLRPPGEFSTTGVSLNGVVNPESEGETTYYFEYISQELFEQSEDNPWASSVSTSVETLNGSDSNDHQVSAKLVDLSPGTRYHYRMIATSPAGISEVAEQTFRTIPLSATVSGVRASRVTPTTAVLDAEIDPGFGPTIYRIEYGLTPMYGSKTMPSESIGEDGVDHFVSTELTGLEPGTTYNYRVLAINLAGPVYGQDRDLHDNLPSRRLWISRLGGVANQCHARCVG